MLAVAIDPAFARVGVSVRLACVSGVAGAANDALTQALDEAAAAARARPVAEVGPIQATRAAYKALGKDPSRYRPASEALWRRLAKGEPVPRIAPLVDLNTLVSLATGRAAGIYDQDGLQPPVHFRVGAAGETYDAIGQDAFNLERLPVLADTIGSFGSPSRDGQRARVTTTTRRFWLVLFDFGAHGLDAELTMAAAACRRYIAATDVVAWQVAGDA